MFVERLRRNSKYGGVHPRAHARPTDLRAGLARDSECYNDAQRRHTELAGRTLDAVYFDQATRDLAA